ncbi:MAG: conserved protein of unknown function [Nitrospira sp.]
MIERRYQRYPVSLPCALLAHDGPHITRSVDLSSKGCRIQNTVRVVPNMVIDLLLFTGDDLPIAIQSANVRWCGAEGIGIEFQALASYHQQRLNLLLNQLKKPH